MTGSGILPVELRAVKHKVLEVRKQLLMKLLPQNVGPLPKRMGVTDVRQGKAQSEK